MKLGALPVLVQIMAQFKNLHLESVMVLSVLLDMTVNARQKHLFSSKSPSYKTYVCSNPLISFLSMAKTQNHDWHNLKVYGLIFITLQNG